MEEVREISKRIFEEAPVTALQYGVTEGYAPLRARVKQYMKEKHNIGRDFDDLIITSGATQVMDLSTKTLCNFGDVVISESPSFIGSLNCFRPYGVQLRGVPGVPPLKKTIAEAILALKADPARAAAMAKAGREAAGRYSPEAYYRTLLAALQNWSR